MDGSKLVGIHIFSLRDKIYSPSIFTPVYSYINFIHLAMKEGVNKKVEYRNKKRKMKRNFKSVK